MSDGQSLIIFYSLIKSFLQMLLELVWEGKYVIITWLYLRYRKIKIQTIFSKVYIRHETHFLRGFFICSNALKDFLASLSPTFTCNLTPYINISTNVRISCWSAKSILMPVLHGFMNFKQIRRYKPNVNARSQFCYFVGNIGKSKTRSNHFQLKSFVNLLDFTKVRKFK